MHTKFRVPARQAFSLKPVGPKDELIALVCAPGSKRSLEAGVQMVESVEGRRLLIVDDTPEHRAMLGRVLGDYHLGYASSGREALRRLETEALPDLVLLDARMPGEDGLEVCRKIKADERLREIPVILMTSLQSDEGAAGIALGAADCITKPFDCGIVRARVRTHLAFRQAKLELARQKAALDEQVASYSAQLGAVLEQLKDGSLETIFRLSRAAEYKDEDTGRHVLRVSYYSGAIARRLARSDCPPDLLLRAAPMHDVGKIGIPDHVLLKRGPLDAMEWALMQQHTLIGAKILAGSQSEIIRLAEVVALTHHERWSGGGYPYGLAETAIPIAGRVVAVADAFDALTSRRSYKQAFSSDVAFATIRAGRGSSFDPDVVDAFLAIQDEILEIKASYPDESQETTPETLPVDAVSAAPVERPNGRPPLAPEPVALPAEAYPGRVNGTGPDEAVSACGGDLRCLTARVAHEFDNLLATIIGYSDLVLQKLDSGQPMKDDLEAVRKAGERASLLNRQLLDLGRAG